MYNDLIKQIMTDPSANRKIHLALGIQSGLEKLDYCLRQYSSIKIRIWDFVAPAAVVIPNWQRL